MAIMAMATVQKNNKRLLAALLASIPLVGLASGWQLTPKLTLDETFSDNVEHTLIDTTSSLVSQVGVLINEEYRSSKAELNLNLHSVYAMYSHDSSLNDDYHTLDAQGRLMLWPDGLSLIGSASITNQTRNAGGNSLADIVSSDTVEVRSYTTGLAYQINNSDYSVNMSVNLSDTSSEDGIGESDGFRSSLASSNGSGARHVFWDLSASHQDLSNNDQDRTMYQSELKIGWITGYKISPFVRYFDESYDGNFGSQAIESNSYGLGFRWLITPRLQFDLSYNKPIDEQIDSNGELFTAYADSSILWTPTNRTSVGATYSQRFYGDSYRVNIKHRNKRLTNTITYAESVETFTRYNISSTDIGLLCPPDYTDIAECILDSPPANQEGLDNVTLTLTQLNEDDVFSLNRRLAWSSVLELPRTTFNLTLSANNREQLNTEGQGDEDQYRSASFSVKRKVSGYSSLTFTGSYHKNIINKKNSDVVRSTQDDQYRRYVIDYTRELNSNLSTVLGVSYLNRNSNRDIYNYDESRVYLQIKKGF